MRIRNENFYTVLGWMLNELELRGNELIIFAIIYSFSQDGESEFTGSLGYLQAFANIKSHNTVTATLQTLQEKGYVVKREFIKDNVRRCAYRVNIECINLRKSGLSKISPNNRNAN